MSVKEYDSQEDMDTDFEDCMERMQEEARLKEELQEAEERVEYARDALMEAEEELRELRAELEQLVESH